MFLFLVFSSLLILSWLLHLLWLGLSVKIQPSLLNRGYTCVSIWEPFMKLQNPQNNVRDENLMKFTLKWHWVTAMVETKLIVPFESHCSTWLLILNLPELWVFISRIVSRIIFPEIGGLVWLFYVPETLLWQNISFSFHCSIFFCRKLCLDLSWNKTKSGYLCFTVLDTGIWISDWLTNQTACKKKIRKWFHRHCLYPFGPYIFLPL